MDATRAEVQDWLEARTGRPLSAADQADLLAAAGLDGQTAQALIDSFAARFGVNLAAFRPQAHFTPEGRRGPPGWPIPAAREVRFPLSLTLLHHAAETGRWPAGPALPDPPPGWHWLNLLLLLLGLPALTALLLAALS
jgi:Protein of unknown function (DUF1493)